MKRNAAENDSTSAHTTTQHAWARKLKLNRETLRSLQDEQLGQVPGGAQPSYGSRCTVPTGDVCTIFCTGVQ